MRSDGFPPFPLLDTNCRVCFLRKRCTLSPCVPSQTPSTFHLHRYLVLFILGLRSLPCSLSVAPAMSQCTHSHTPSALTALPLLLDGAPALPTLRSVLLLMSFCLDCYSYFVKRTLHHF
jgi:hypothetical protein